MRGYLAVAYAAVFLAARPALGDVVEFRVGGQAEEVQARRDGDWVVATSTAGTFRFPASDVRRVTTTESAADAWTARQADADRDHPAERRQLVLWALGNGLTNEALELLDSTPPALRDTPELASLLNLRAALGPSWTDPRTPPRIGPESTTFQTARSDHILLLHQHDDTQARQLLTRLEQVVTTYFLIFAELGLNPKVPDERLVVVWFAKRTDYCEFLRRNGAASFTNTEGYYHPGKHLVAFYDERSSDRSRRVAHEIEVARGRLEALPTNDAAATALRAEIDRMTLLEAQRREQFETSTAIHEMAHLLMWSSGLSPRVETLPVWLHEGLAMQFEVMRGGRWTGFSQPHTARLTDWRTRCPSPALAPLVLDRGLGRSFDRLLYTQAWALVYHLLHNDPLLLRGLISALQADSGEGSSAAERSLIYLDNQASGGLKGLESSWRRQTGLLARPGRTSTPDANTPASPTLTSGAASAVIQK